MPHVPTTSPNFGWLLPTEEASPGAWDNLLNAVFTGLVGTSGVDGIDKVVNDIKTTADAALARAGGDMTGELDILTTRYTSVDTADTGTVTLDLDTGNFFHTAPTGIVTYAFSNVPAGPDAVFIVIEITNGAAFQPVFPTEVQWVGGTTPTFTSGIDVITGYTRDGGTTWRFSLAMENVKP